MNTDRTDQIAKMLTSSAVLVGATVAIFLITGMFMLIEPSWIKAVCLVVDAVLLLFQLGIRKRLEDMR